MTAKRPSHLDRDGHTLDRFIERWYPYDNKPPRKDAEKMLMHMLKFAQLVEYVADEHQWIWMCFGVKLVVCENGMVATALPPDAERPAHRGRPA